jgi:hypothetical protein
MRKIIGIGESILDIVFKNRQVMSATPGGSVFNGLISLGRLGLPVYFVSDIGQDQVGKLITDFMENNGLSSRYMNLHPDSNTAVALAFLNENNDANYTFYKDYTVKGLQGNFPPINPDDIVVFGSYYALNPLLRKRVKAFLEKAVQKSALIYYDINFRKSHSYQAKALNPVLIENYRYADIIRDRKTTSGLCIKNSRPAKYIVKKWLRIAITLFLQRPTKMWNSTARDSRQVSLLKKSPPSAPWVQAILSMRAYYTGLCRQASSVRT